MTSFKESEETLELFRLRYLCSGRASGLARVECKGVEKVHCGEGERVN